MGGWDTSVLRTPFHWDRVMHQAWRIGLPLGPVFQGSVSCCWWTGIVLEGSSWGRRQPTHHSVFNPLDKLKKMKKKKKIHSPFSKVYESSIDSINLQLILILL